MNRPHDERSRELTRRLGVVLAWQRGLPAPDVEMVDELIQAGEYSVALENLCTQLFEYDVEVDVSLRHELEHLGKEVGVDVPRLLGDPWAGMSWERCGPDHGTSADDTGTPS